MARDEGGSWDSDSLVTLDVPMFRKFLFIIAFYYGIVIVPWEYYYFLFIVHVEHNFYTISSTAYALWRCKGDFGALIVGGGGHDPTKPLNYAPMLKFV